MTHPNAIELEAFAVGETPEDVAAHVEGCGACRSYVAAIRGEAARGPSAATRRALTRTTARRTWAKGSAVVVPLALAASILVWLGRGPRPVAAPATPSSAIAMADPEPETRFKGGPLVAVVRERDGAQARFTSALKVKPGDRLRVEVALDREQAILAAVVGDDGSYLEIMPLAMRGRGTHFSERSARIDDKPLRGTVVVGSPEALAKVQRARRVQPDPEIQSIRIDWEDAP